MTAKYKKSKTNKSDLIFYIIVAIVPLTQVLIFYFGVNLNSVLMAFQKYTVDPVTSLGQYRFSGLDSFNKLFETLKAEGLFLSTLKNSFIVYFCDLVAGLGLSMVFSYYIFKKMFLHNVFKVILFIPSILSSVVVILIFRYFAENALPNVVNTIFKTEIGGFLSDTELSMGTLIFFGIWSSFGTKILLFSGAMSGINDGVIEAATLDGVTPIKEFFLIVLPMIYPTIVTFLVIGIAGLFTNQLGLFSFFGGEAQPNTWTVGYWLFRNARNATFPEYTMLSAASVILTLVAVPFTLVAKYFLQKFGPSEE